MKIKLSLTLLIPLLLPSLSSAGVPPPGKEATNLLHIVKAAPDAEGAVEIDYSDGSHDLVPKDMRGSYEDRDPIKQDEVFSDIEISSDKRLVGWVPQYMICAQSWPCTPELVIYQHGRWPKFITPPFGIVWHWMFTSDGYAVVIHYGFPHGDADGEYGLFDLESLREDAKFTRHTDKGDAPDWAEQLQVREPD